MALNPEKVEQFLAGLEKLTRETGIEIGGCGCCGSPFLSELEAGQAGDKFGYHTDQGPEDGVTWAEIR